MPRGGQVSLTRAERGILLKGSFSCRTQLTCGRCLAFFPHSATLRVEEMFYPSMDILTGLPQALPEGTPAAVSPSTNTTYLTPAR